MAETTKEAATPDERYQVSGTRIRLSFYPAIEVEEYNEMSFGEQLQYAHKHKLKKTGIESKIQDGVQDPFQDDSYDPWKGKKPEEHKMYTLLCRRAAACRRGRVHHRALLSRCPGT